MIKLFSDEEYEKAGYYDLLLLKCYTCEEPFYKQKGDIKKVYLNKGEGTCQYCTNECRIAAQIKYGSLKKLVNCNCCGIEFSKRTSQVVRSKNHFCSRSCNAKYHNVRKSKGTRRSKLEVWIEEQLTKDYPELNIDYNEKNQIGCELDIYIKNYKLAFELNGIFHYEPVYGESKLNQTQNNDQRKFQACIEKGISLCVIDTSNQKYFKPDSSKKYYDIIKKIINENSNKL